MSASQSQIQHPKTRTSSGTLKSKLQSNNVEDDQRRNGGRQPPTVCIQCHQQFSTTLQLNVHFLSSHTELLAQEFNHLKSWKTSGSEEHLDRHTIKFNNGESIGFQCPQCNYFAKWPTELQKHIMVHSDERPHICVVCGSTYKWKWDLGRHFDKSHGGGVLMSNPYKKNKNYGSGSGGPHANLTQPTCTTNHLSLNVSAPNVATDLYPKLPQTTSISTPQPDSKSTTAAESASTKANFFATVANGCDKLTASKRLGSTLLSSVHSNCMPTNNYSGQKWLSNLKLLAPTDRDKFKNEANDENHGVPTGSPVQIKEILQGNDTDKDDSEAYYLPYSCPMCDFRARWKSELKSHATNHTVYKPFLCPFCHYRSKWKWDVVKHMRRCNWKILEDGSSLIGPLVNVSNKEMQALIIYKPPATEEITNPAEAMLYANEQQNALNESDEKQHIEVDCF